MDFYRQYMEDFGLLKKTFNIFHYCPEDAFYQILDLENRQLHFRAKEKDFFHNDKTECKWFWQCLEDSTKKIIAEEIGESVKWLHNKVNNTKIYVTCFSKESDSHYMWKNYGKADKACNIGLNFYYSKEYDPTHTQRKYSKVSSIDNSIDYSKNFNGFFGEVEYLHPKQVNKRILRLIGIMKKNIQNYRGNYSQFVLQYVYCLQILIKNPNNDHPKEKEFRAFFTMADEDCIVEEKFVLVSFNIEDQYKRNNLIDTHFDFNENKMLTDKFFETVHYTTKPQNIGSLEEIGVNVKSASFINDKEVLNVQN